MDLFVRSFPEIAHHAHCTRIRETLMECEEASWPRGNAYRDANRAPAPWAQIYIRDRLAQLLEDPDPVVISITHTDEFIAFLEGYVQEKKAW